MLFALLIAATLVACGRKTASWEDLNQQAQEALRAGRSIEAEQRLRAALEMARQAEPGSEDAGRVPVSLHRLARFYEARQRYGQAVEYFALALEADIARLSADDPSLWDTVSRLAGAHESQLQFTEAKEVYKRFLGVQEKALGHDALPLASTLVQIGRLSRLRGAYEESEESFQRALAIRIRHLGQDNEQLPEILTEYVALLRDTEEPYKADLMEERVAELRMKATARRMQEAQRMQEPRKE